MTQKTDPAITRKAPFDLTDSEVALKAKTYADGMTACEAELSRIKAQAKHDTAKVAEKQLELGELREQCSSKKEMRVVDCYADPDYGARVWRIKRCDTGAIVDSKQMTAEEVADLRQLDMIDELASTRDADAAADEASFNDDDDDADADAEAAQ